MDLAKGDFTPCQNIPDVRFVQGAEMGVLEFAGAAIDLISS
jgi:hypothetical protein